MTDYNEIPFSKVDQDSPVTQELMTWLRDNAIAINEGSPGAPPITTDAIKDRAITFDKFIPEIADSRLISCSINCTSKAGSFTINSSFNVNSITETSGGAYTLDFIVNTKTAHYYNSQIGTGNWPNFDRFEANYITLDSTKPKTVSEVSFLTIAGGLFGFGNTGPQPLQREFSFSCMSESSR